MCECEVRFLLFFVINILKNTIKPRKKQRKKCLTMALYDNKHWLLSHIRNSFISTDDTGMCETVMVGEARYVRDNIFSKEPFGDPELSDDDDDDNGSYDIQFDSEYQMRDRTATAARLEKLEYQSRKAARIKHVKWENKKGENAPESEDLFVPKPPESQQEKKQSSLTKLMILTANMPLNPYTEFARYDGTAQVNLPTKNYRIYLTMLPEDERNYPLSVCCVATARIQELIGLILLKLSIDYKGDYALKPVTFYGLYITEEDGEVDRDFPQLDIRECVSKFGFPCLGLVEHQEEAEKVQPEPEYIIELEFPVESKEIKKTSTSKAEETQQNLNDMALMDMHNRTMEAHLYKSYRVYIVNKIWWWNIEVHLGISSEKIEIDPIHQKNSKLQLVKQVPVSHPMDCIASCEESENRGSRTAFRVIYSSGFGSGDRMSNNLYSPSSLSLSSTLQSSPTFKHYDFEAEKDVAEEIVHKINMILKLRSTNSRREYLAAKERKHLSKKKSFKYL